MHAFVVYVLAATYVIALVLPGVSIGWALGLRGWTLAATTPLTTYALVTTTGTMCTLTGVRWSPALLAVVTVAVVVTALAVRLTVRNLRGKPPPDERRPLWPGWRGAAVIGATIAGCGIGALVIGNASGWLTVPPQDWDAAFHANAIRYIADHGNADPAALAAINRWERPDGFYYPNGYHLLAAVVYRLSGASIPVVMDASFALVPPMFTLGLVGLLHRFRARAALAAATALVSCAASTVPFDLIARGPLVNYATGLVLVPAFLVLLHAALADRLPGAAVLVAAGAAALLIIHPGSMFVAAVFALAMVSERWLLAGRRIGRDLVMLVAVGAMSAVLALPALIGSLNSVADAPVFAFPANLPAARALGDLVAFSHGLFAPRWFLFVPLVVALTALRPLRPLWWLLVGSSVFAVLFVLSAAYSHPLVPQLTRPWWNDRWRIIAVATFGAILLAGHGIVVISDVGRRVMARLPAPTVRRVVLGSPVAAVLVVAVIAAGSGGFYARENSNRVWRLEYRPGLGLTPLERDGMAVLADLAPPGSMVLNQDGDGSAWMYALTGVRPVNGHLDTGGLSPAQKLLHNRFNKVDSDPVVQATVRRLDIRYVFVGRSFIRTNFRRADGLRRLDLVRSVELVYENPDVRIYRVRLPQEGSS